MARFIVLSLLLALAACSGSGSEADEEARHRADMAAATEAARDRLDWFWEHAEAPEPDEFDFTLKVALPPQPGAELDADGPPEEAWIEDVVRGGDIVSGVLSLDPQREDLARGDRIEAPQAAILDWAFFRGEQLIGHYTTRVMLDRLPPDDAAILRALLGENPE